MGDTITPVVCRQWRDSTLVGTVPAPFDRVPFRNTAIAAAFTALAAHQPAPGGRQ
jgi:hypothetical protein